MTTSNMPTETILLISTKNQDFVSRFTVEGLGIALSDELSRLGGACWTGWIELGILKVRIQGVPIDKIRYLMNSCFESEQRKGGTISVVEHQAEVTPLPNVQAGDIPWGTVVRQKLTKKLIKLLPEGAYLLSNVYSSVTGEEKFSVQLGNLATREETWRLAVIAGANNRLCRLVWTEIDFNGFRFPEGNLPKTRR